MAETVVTITIVMVEWSWVVGKHIFFYVRRHVFNFSFFHSSFYVLFAHWPGTVSWHIANQRAQYKINEWKGAQNFVDIKQSSAHGIHETKTVFFFSVARWTLSQANIHRQKTEAKHTGTHTWKKRRNDTECHAHWHISAHCCKIFCSNIDDSGSDGNDDGDSPTKRNFCFKFASEKTSVCIAWKFRVDFSYVWACLSVAPLRVAKENKQFFTRLTDTKHSANLKIRNSPWISL